MAKLPFVRGEFGMMHKKSALAVALAAALLPVSAMAETVFLGGFGKGAVPGVVQPGDSGTETVVAVGVWMDPTTTSGNTRLEVELPAWATLTGAPVPKVWSRINGRQRSQYIAGSDGSQYPITFDVDYACGVPGLDIDPSTGEMYLVAGHVSYYSNGDCDTGDRWLAKYAPAFGRFQWIGSVGRMHGIEFMPDGRLFIESSTYGANSRGAINEVNKTNASLTYRARPAVGNYFRDLVYNPGDSRLYAIEQCYVIRINPADWSSTNYYRSELCSQRRVSVALIEDNRFLVRSDSYLAELVINPADGSFVSYTNVLYHGNSWPRFPMVASKTDPATVSKSCTTVNSRKVTCDFGDVKMRGAVAVDLPIQYAVPMDSLPGVYAGSLKWYRNTTLIGSQVFNSRVLADDIEVAVSPTSGRYNIGDTFSLDIDITASGGNPVSDIELVVPIDSKIFTVTGFSGASTCGLSREGVRCTGLSVQGDATLTITIDLEAAGGGGAAIQAYATAAAGDVDPSNDSAGATFVVGTATDLVAEGTEGGAGAIGKAMNLEVSVSNEGPDPATNAVLVFPGDAGFDLGTATTNLGTCAASGSNVRCSFGTMAMDTTATVNIKVTPKRAGNLTLRAQASSGVLDITPGNNTYAFEVSVPTLPFTIALGQATPSSSTGDVRSVLQLAVTPASGSDGVEISSISGSLAINAKGLSLKRKVLVFEDLDANGLYDETDTFVGSGALSAESDGFTVEFAKPISAPAKTTSNFILAVQAEGAPRVAGVPFGGSTGGWMALAMAAMLPLAYAFTRRRAGLVVLGLMAVAFVGACSDDVEDLLANAKVSATVTSVEATLLGDTNSPVSATGLPITGPTVTLSR